MRAESGHPPVTPGDGPSAERRARGVFFAVTAGALGFYLWIGRDAWFVLDEWYFLALRSAGSAKGLLSPHNEHWSTLPILLWRALFHVFGIRTYTPYLLALLLAHLALAYLLRVVMRRADVPPWTATAAASLFLLFGAGADDILWAFQIGFVAAIVFGLIQLLLSDHPGPVNRRDGVAVLAGLAALMCSGVGVTMVVISGLATLVRRGWRAAAVQTVPLAAIYALWYAVYGRTGLKETTKTSDIPSFVVGLLSATFRSLAQIPYLGIALGAALVVGLWLAWWGRPTDELRRIASEPGAMLVGAVVFVFITSTGRAGAADSAFFHAYRYAPRYVYVVAALVLPAVAVALTAIGRRLGRWGLVLVPIVFLVAIPGNVRLAVDRERTSKADFAQMKLLMLSAAHLPVGRLLPPDDVPVPLLGGKTTVAWLRANAAAGRVPSPGRLSPQQVADVSQRLLLEPAGLLRVPPDCRSVSGPRVVTSKEGDIVLTREGNVGTITYLPSSGLRPHPTELRSSLLPAGVRFAASGLRFEVQPSRSGGMYVCG